MNSLRIIAAAALACCGFPVHAALLESSDPVRAVHEAALRAPFDDAALEAYLKTLPQVRLKSGVRVYVMEGDLFLTSYDVRAELARKQAQGKRPLGRPELIVNLQNGQPDYWKEKNDRVLRYSVDRQSFPNAQQYEAVVRNMRVATGDWESACPECGIKFEYQSWLDQVAKPETVTFVVTLLDAGGDYIAAAFFPSDPLFRRYLNIDPSYFSTDYDPVGVLRHELGHVLGYRHEHTRDVAGCYREDNRWKPLTPYDPHSVMHYFCGGGGTMDLSLTEVDRDGHRLLYASLGNPVGASAREDELTRENMGTLIVRFEGQQTPSALAEDVARVTRVLVKEGLVTLSDYQVQHGDTLCTIYREKLDFPESVGCPVTAMSRLAMELNPGRESILKVLLPGQILKVPENVSLRHYPFYRTYNTTSDSGAQQLKSDRTKWTFSEVQTTDAKSSKAEAVFAGYEIKLRAPAIDSVRRIPAQIRSPQVYVTFIPPKLPEMTLHSVREIAPRDHVDACRASETDVGEGNYLQLFAAMAQIPDSECTNKCAGPNCTQVVMFDRPVDLNPDIKDAISVGGKQVLPALSSETGSGKRLCKETVFRPRDHHGTHLAGIIASQRNGYGFIGLSPESRIASYEYEPMSDPELADLIQDHMRPAERKRKVFLFASTFRAYPDDVIVARTMQLKRLEDRYARLAPERIRSLQPLWITAVGQTGGENPVFPVPTEIYAKTALAPMNLGDLPNVVVVTACGDCTDSGASLIDDAHYSISDRLVHIAAPGRDIPGWADGSAMSVARGGTSQAAAFVAGVAAAMKNCHGDAYADAVTTRLRLMTTARPVLHEGDAKKVRSGIVDPLLAMKDPTRHWLKLFGDDAGLKAVEIAGWCVPSVQLLDNFTGEALETNGYFPTNKITRITRYRRISNELQKRWVFFRSRAGEDIVRSEPGTWNITARLLKLGDGSFVALDKIEELLLADRPVPVLPGC